MKKTGFGISSRIAVIFSVFFIATIAIGGTLTYQNQMRIYKKQCEQSVRNTAEYLAGMMENEGSDFAKYLENYEKYYAKMRVPLDFTEYTTAQNDFYGSFAKAFPDMTYGEDITFDDLPEDLKLKYLEYNYERWMLTYEQAMQELGVAYAYCMMMDETRDYVMYVTDIERDSIADFLDTDYPNAIETDSSELTDEEISDYAKYIYVHWMGPNPREKYPFLWQTWDAGKALDGYQEWNNEFGHTYAYYTPIVIDGQKLGIVAAEIEVDRVNKEILSNSLMQILLVCVILFLGLIISVTLINSRYISRLSRIDSAVRGYTLNHDQDAVEKIEKNIKGNEEISSLGRGLVTMITEIDNYIKQLTQSKAETMALKELANKDSLTGINNKTAYDVEIDRLQFEMDHGLLNSYGIAVADLNYLKRINDNYGHEKGNIAIKNICSIICRIFSHSPVFRIGGDEFVVILKGEDLEHINELMTKFKSTVDEIYNDTSLENWERVSAAIGYAVYDPKLDSRAESVFQRADAAMYQNKKEMKALM